MTKSSNHVSPVPEEVEEAGKVELAEPWAESLQAFVKAKLRPAASIADASTSAEIRAAFLEHSSGTLEKREVPLKLAMKGFHEKTEMYKVGSKRTSKRVYELRFDSGTFPATLEAQAAPAAAPAAPRNLFDPATARRSEAERVAYRSATR